jgi:threonyl-tRNA synthetase
VTKAANDIINYNYPFERLVLEKSVAKQMFKDNRFSSTGTVDCADNHHMC